MTEPTRPTNVRYLIVGVVAVAAMWMYIDRVCFSTLKAPIGKELGISDRSIAYVQGAFFLTYAALQIPIGSLADRYGARLILTICIAAWSLCTAATAWANSVAMLIAVRLALGACEAGAYPAAASLIRRWSSAAERGRLSSIVAFGGRFGGAVAPRLTVLVAFTWLGSSATETADWRGTFLIYGFGGLFFAGIFWWAVRNRPDQHPWANQAEADRVPPPPPVVGSGLTWTQRMLAIVASRNMWLFGLTQFMVNIGWIFLITNFPDLLKNEYDVPPEDRGTMQSITLFSSCIGMLCGGVFADAMYKFAGPRWGRALPIGLVTFGCAASYIAATQFHSAWGVTIALTLMSFFVDLGVPSIWAFAQDVGGRQVGAALGWGNMWGNFGAAVSPVALQEIRTAYGWDTVFLTCAGCFALAGLFGFNLNATQHIVAEPPKPPVYDDEDPEPR